MSMMKSSTKSTAAEKIPSSRRDGWTLTSRRLGDNQIVFTFNQIKDYLAWENIPLENAILRVLYAYTLL